MTKVVNWYTQQDVYTGRDLSLSEARWQGIFGAIEVVGNATLIGGAIFKGGSLGLNLARGSEEAIQGVREFGQGLKNFEPLVEDLRAVRSVLRNPIQSGKAVASVVREGYTSLGGARGALRESWNFAREEGLPRLNPRNYTAEFSGWSNGANVNLRFGGRLLSSGTNEAIGLAGRDVEDTVSVFRKMSATEADATLSQMKLQPRIPGTDPTKYLSESLAKVEIFHNKGALEKEEKILEFVLDKSGYDSMMGSAVPQFGSQGVKAVKYHFEKIPDGSGLRNIGVPPSHLDWFNSLIKDIRPVEPK